MGFAVLRYGFPGGEDMGFPVGGDIGFSEGAECRVQIWGLRQVVIPNKVSVSHPLHSCAEGEIHSSTSRNSFGVTPLER